MIYAIAIVAGVAYLVGAGYIWQRLSRIETVELRFLGTVAWPATALMGLGAIVARRRQAAKLLADNTTQERKTPYR